MFGILRSSSVASVTAIGSSRHSSCDFGRKLSNMADHRDSQVELTSAQTEKLLQFQDLTGINDLEKCRQVLDRHGWNMEAAVHDTFNENEGQPPVFEQPVARAVPPRMPMMNISPTYQRVYTVARRRPQGWMAWGYFLLMLPFRFTYTTIRDIFMWAYRLIIPDPRRIVRDPLADVESFIAKFQSLYGENHPVFYRGSYSQALNDAKKEIRFLVVFLHGENDDQSAEFSRTSLCAPEVIDFLGARSLFWACSVEFPEGYRVSQALRPRSYPFVSLICLREHKMTVVARLEGVVPADELIARLMHVMEENEPALAQVRADREERNFTQTLRAQQDVAYLESLRADQEKERKKQEERERKEREEQEAREKEEAVQRRKEELARLRIEKASTIPDEPDDDDPEATKIILKLPNGTRLERRFLMSHSLEDVYHFAFCHKDAPDEFQIVTNFPRRVLPCQGTEEAPEVITIKEAGLGKSEVLFVQDIGD
ncbi:FAF2 [Branchiostoma lanceolatum]|uniref:FAF2 protein n=1 Tax=Branchiostoma lanceolatum TaxID=7740 RepID=A0A8J9Z5U0_BRALA|nr:FAF2 [Branchiostoma lanceolatum]